MAVCPEAECCPPVVLLRPFGGPTMCVWAAHEHLDQPQPWGQRDLLSQLTGLAQS